MPHTVNLHYLDSLLMLAGQSQTIDDRRGHIGCNRPPPNLPDGVVHSFADRNVGVGLQAYSQQSQGTAAGDRRLEGINDPGRPSQGNVIRLAIRGRNQIAVERQGRLDCCELWECLEKDSSTGCARRCQDDGAEGCKENAESCHSALNLSLRVSNVYVHARKEFRRTRIASSCSRRVCSGEQLVSVRVLAFHSTCTFKCEC